MICGVSSGLTRILKKIMQNRNVVNTHFRCDAFNENNSVKNRFFFQKHIFSCNGLFTNLVSWILYICNSDTINAKSSYFFGFEWFTNENFIFINYICKIFN